jgi:hypothetical protein
MVGVESPGLAQMFNIPDILRKLHNLFSGRLNIVERIPSDSISISSHFKDDRFESIFGMKHHRPFNSEKNAAYSQSTTFTRKIRRIRRRT